ncbi:MAG: hypothetical protein ABFD69_12680 [Candidatus Sumerlaeia bacterium]
MRFHAQICLAIAAILLVACNDGRPAGNLRRMHEVAAPKQGPYVTIEPIGAVNLNGVPRHMTLNGGVLYAFLNEYGLATLDVSDAAHPVLTSHLAGKPGHVTPGTHRYFMGLVDGGRMFAADRYHGLALLSLADPLRPQYVSTRKIPGDQPSDIARIDGDLFIAAGGSGLAHARADAVGTTASLVLPFFDFVTAAVFYPPHYLLLADNFTGGMQILDVRNPVKPALVHNMQICGFCDSIEPFDGFIVIGGRRGGLIVVDMSDPANPSLLSYFMDGFNTISCQTRWGKTRLIVATHMGTIDVFELADPRRPLWLGRVAAGAPVHSLAVKDDILYAGANYVTSNNPSGKPEQLRVYRLVEHK